MSAIEDCLAVLVVANGGPQFVLALDRHDRGEEGDDGRRMLEVGVKVGAGEAEDGAGLIGAGQDGVECHAVGLVGEGEQERHDTTTRAKPTDDVRALVAIEHPGKDLGGEGEVGGRPAVQLVELTDDGGAGEGDVALLIFPGGPDGGGGEDVPDEGGVDRASKGRES